METPPELHRGLDVLAVLQPGNQLQLELDNNGFELFEENSEHGGVDIRHTGPKCYIGFSSGWFCWPEAGQDNGRLRHRTTIGVGFRQTFES